LLKGEDSGYRLLVEYRETFPFIGSPSLGYPLDYPFWLFAEKEVLAFVFTGWCAVSVLIGASAPSFVGTVDLYKQVFRVVFVPYV
jgi:hypothetical protein